MTTFLLTTVMSPRVESSVAPTMGQEGGGVSTHI